MTMKPVKIRLDKACRLYYAPDVDMATNNGAMWMRRDCKVLPRKLQVTMDECFRDNKTMKHTPHGGLEIDVDIPALSSHMSLPPFNDRYAVVPTSEAWRVNGFDPYKPVVYAVRYTIMGDVDNDTLWVAEPYVEYIHRKTGRDGCQAMYIDDYNGGRIVIVRTDIYDAQGSDIVGIVKPLRV